MDLKEKILEVIAGPHVAAVATINKELPHVRFMVLAGQDDLTQVGATLKSSAKVAQLAANPHTSISVWSGQEFSDPYVEIQATGKIHEDLETKKRYWNPMYEQYFQSVDNPDYVLLIFTPDEITHHGQNMESMDVWKR